MNGTIRESSQRAGQVDWRMLLVVFAATAAVGLALIVVLRGAPAQWCEFTEFGFLSRIPAYLALIAEVGLAILVAIGGLVWYLAGRAPKIPYFFAAGLLSAVAVSFVVPNPDCEAYYSTLPPPPDPTHQPATLSLVFGAPFDGEHPSGAAWCQRENRGEDVFIIQSDTYASSGRTDWRFRGDQDNFVDFRVYPAGDKYWGPDSHLWLRLLVAPEVGRDAISVYTEEAGGTVVIEAAADGTSGTLTFSNLALRDAPVGNGAGLPQTVSGRISWTCSGEEES